MPALPTVTNNSSIYGYLPQLCRAMRERLLAVVDSYDYQVAADKAEVYDLPTDEIAVLGSNAAGPLHRQMQVDLEWLATHYVDHTAAPTLPSTTQPNPMFTVSTWRSAAGLNSSGFRRAATWADPSAAPSFAYGLIQTDDIAGWWITEDIIKGLKALRWTLPYGLSSITNGAHRKRYSGLDGAPEDDTDYAAQLAYAQSRWNAESWTTTSAGSIACIYVDNYGVESGRYLFALCDASTLRGKATFLVEAPVGGVVVFAGKAKRAGVYPYIHFRGYDQDTYYTTGSRAFSSGATEVEMEDEFPPDVYDTLACPVPLYDWVGTGTLRTAEWDFVASHIDCRIEWTFTDT